MTKVTLHDDGQSEVAAPSSIKKAAEVTDRLGRKIGIRKLNALDKVDLAMLVGPEGSQNEAVIGPCALAFSVTAIDGEVIYPAAKFSELRVTLKRLDDEGIEAVALGHQEHFGIGAEESSVDEQRDRLKNS